MRTRCVLLFGLLVLSAVRGISAGSETAGREIWLRGKGVNGRRIPAAVGSGASVSAEIVPCSGCHGVDGRGRPEGDVVPPAIRWTDLTRPWDAQTASGRRRKPYDESLLRRAIGLGIDSSGNTLAPIMPRYDLTREESDGLFAYLKSLGSAEPGVSDTAITVGVFLPPPGDLAAALRAGITTTFAGLNETAGVFGRKLELQFANAPQRPGELPRALKEFIEARKPFALLSPYIAAAEFEAGAVLDQAGIPAIGALTLYPSDASRSIFYLYSGVGGEAAALAKAVRRPPAIVFAGEANAKVAKQIGAPTSMVIDLHQTDPAKAVRVLRESGTEFVLVLCPAAAATELIEAAAAVNWKPDLLIPGSLSSAALLKTLPVKTRHAVLAFSNRPDERSEKAGTLASAGDAGVSHLPARMTAVSEARILYEGLVRSGRELSREKFVEKLEGLYEFNTGFGPAVTFGSNRRFGVASAWLAEINVATGSLQSFKGPSPESSK